MPSHSSGTGCSRRRFLQTSVAAAAVGTWPNVVRGNSRWPTTLTGTDYTARDPRVKEIAMQAIDAAQHAGATYADVRITLQRNRSFGTSFVEGVYHGIGVRALRDGYWGFASTPDVSSADAVRVGRDAAQLSTVNHEIRLPRQVHWTPVPVIPKGDWTAPVEIDPFEVDVEEIITWSAAMSSYHTRLAQQKHPKGNIKILGVSVGAWISRTDAVFVSTEGSYIVQTFNTIQPSVSLMYTLASRELNGFGLPGNCMYFMTDQVMSGLWPTAGWEIAMQLPVEATVDHTIAALEEDVLLPVMPVELGRYDVVFDWQTIGSFVNATFGRATELDRALGHEANAGGTSYLGPVPSDVLGTTVAAPLVTLTANRSTPGAASTVRWDAEGVVPEAFTLVNEGKLANYQTTREGAGWLAASGIASMSAVQSSGCSGAPSIGALSLPLSHQPNLLLAPARDETSSASLMSSVKKGLLICEGSISTDFQALNGYGTGRTYEIRNGKKVARVQNAALLFRSPEFWNNILAVGGASSPRWTTGASVKGEPQQYASCSVSAPPDFVKDVTVIDATRRS